MNIKKISIAFLLMLSAKLLGQGIQRVEPPNWWIGMKTPLQLLFYGENLTGSNVSVDGTGIEITKVHFADSPYYLFVDVKVAPDAKPGEYIFTITKGKKSLKYKYRFEQRRENSAERSSFSSADLIYLIMPDRFVNGNSNIDNMQGAIERVNRNNHHGRHGGDIQGIIDKLDYLKELGITAIWTTPLLFDNEPVYSYHGYACSDYYQIDPRFGTNDLYRKLTEEAHKRGIKIIKDVVTNHCGTDHWQMKDLPFKDWINYPEGIVRSNGRFSTVSDPNVSKADLEGCVNGWFDTSMPDMRTENPFVLQYFKQVFVWWIEWANIDGLRVDTYPYNEKYSMAQWTNSLIAEYPNINIVGECWSSAPNIIAYWDGASKNKDGYNSGLPSVMDFPLMDAIEKGLKSETFSWNTGMNSIYDALSLDFVYHDPKTLMIFLDNHDTNRFADLMNGNHKKIKLGLTLLATLRGVPQLYYGTELMFRSHDLNEGHGGARIDFPGGWKEDRKNLFNPTERNAEETEVFEHTKKLFNWRKTNATIHNGKTMHFIPKENTYSFFRYDDNGAIFVFINATDTPQDIEWQRYTEITEGFSFGKSILDDKTVKVGDKIVVPKMESIVIEFIKQNQD